MGTRCKVPTSNRLVREFPDKRDPPIVGFKWVTASYEDVDHPRFYELKLPPESFNFRDPTSTDHDKDKILIAEMESTVCK